MSRSDFRRSPWAQPAPLRNRIVHGYWPIDLEILYTTARDLLPKFTEHLRKALAALEAEPERGESNAESNGLDRDHRVDP